MGSENYTIKMEGLTRAHGNMEKLRDLGNCTISLEIWPMRATGCRGNSMEKVKS